MMHISIFEMMDVGCAIARKWIAVQTAFIAFLDFLFFDFQKKIPQEDIYSYGDACQSMPTE